MPARYAPHDRTYVAWPREKWRWSIDEARKEYAAIVESIARFEPVTLIAHPDDASGVSSYLKLGERVELLEMLIDSAWVRDNGPLFVTDGEGGVAAVNFRFNGWGGR